MKLPVIVLFFLIALGCFKQNYLYAKADTLSEESKPGRTPGDSIIPPVRIRTGVFNTFWVGPRINYLQGKYGFLGASAAFMWHNIGYIPESHIGFSAGMDFRLTKSTIYAPKITVEGRYTFFLARVGYTYFTDFKSDFEHRISTEIGLSLISFLDITYLHSFGSERNPFGLNEDYLNLTLTIPLNM